VNEGEPDAFWLSWWADYPDPEDFLFRSSTQRVPDLPGIERAATIRNSTG